MAGSKTDKVIQYRKPIMIGLIALAIIICIFATYITTYNSNKVTKDDIFTDTPSGTYVSEKDFNKYFETFNIYLSTKTDAVFNDDNTLYSSGTYKFTVQSKKADGSGLQGTTMTVKLGLGADWIKYKSNTSSSTTVTFGTDKVISISGIDKYFPANGPLWFTTSGQPRLYAYVTFTAKINGEATSCYTYLTINYSSYSKVPTTK